MTRDRARRNAVGSSSTKPPRKEHPRFLERIARHAIPISGVLLVLWLAGTLLEGPGWIHGLLTGGIFLLIYGIVVRDTPPPAS